MKLFGTFEIPRNVAVILRFALFAATVLVPILSAIFWDLQALWSLVPVGTLLAAQHVNQGLKKQ